MMYAYVHDKLVELEIQSGRSRLDRPKHEILIISVSDIQIALGFVMGDLALLVVSQASEDTRNEIN